MDDHGLTVASSTAPRPQAAAATAIGPVLTFIYQGSQLGRAEYAQPEEAVSSESAQTQRGNAGDIAAEMKQLLLLISLVAVPFANCPGIMGDALTERIDTLQWGGYGLRSSDRDDLRWLLVREGGVGQLAQSAADALSNFQSEINAIDAQLGRIEQALPAQGDLSRKYRCGLGKALVVAGAGTVPPAAGQARPRPSQRVPSRLV